MVKMQLLITPSVICYNRDFSFSELYFLLSPCGIFSLGVSLIPFYGIRVSFMAVTMLFGSKQLHLFSKNMLITGLANWNKSLCSCGITAEGGWSSKSLVQSFLLVSVFSMKVILF